MTDLLRICYGLLPDSYRRVTIELRIIPNLLWTTCRLVMQQWYPLVTDMLRMSNAIVTEELQTTYGVVTDLLRTCYGLVMDQFQTSYGLAHHQ